MYIQSITSIDAIKMVIFFQLYKILIGVGTGGGGGGGAAGVAAPHPNHKVGGGGRDIFSPHPPTFCNRTKFQF